MRLWPGTADCLCGLSKQLADFTLLDALSTPTDVTCGDCVSAFDSVWPAHGVTSHDNTPLCERRLRMWDPHWVCVPWDILLQSRGRFAWSRLHSFGPVGPAVPLLR